MINQLLSLYSKINKIKIKTTKTVLRKFGSTVEFKTRWTVRMSDRLVINNQGVQTFMLSKRVGTKQRISRYITELLTKLDSRVPVYVSSWVSIISMDE